MAPRGGCWVGVADSSMIWFDPRPGEFLADGPCNWWFLLEGLERTAWLDAGEIGAPSADTADEMADRSDWERLWMPGSAGAAISGC
jgi:hypothetical protein